MRGGKEHKINKKKGKEKRMKEQKVREGKEGTTKPWEAWQ